MSVLRRSLALVVLLASTPVFATQLLTNGGFETGDFTGFTVVGNHNYVTFGSFDGYTPHSGTYYAVLGNIGTPDGSISQSFHDVAGSAYTFSFYLANDGGLPNNFMAMFDGSTLLNTTNTGVMPYTLYSYTVTGTGHDSITFLDRNDPGYFALDDVSVSSIPTPEPSSLILLGTGLLGVFAGVRRRVAR